MNFLHHYAGLLLLALILIAVTASNWREVTTWWSEFFAEITSAWRDVTRPLP